ncbi:hypothetical protein [Novosphingobium sp.]|uniref:hypothetical protein n=1 Tax=Novosphingobium sp. TaxID=1874826 RepID=UPI0025F6DAA6|nr:hypothetical protein [Novosphingobium sp.]MCC6925498.1 hypothetical protein [Novosphingobium sp.]
MFGFGTRMNQVFASRWKAVTWSIGILLTAYCTVPMADQARQHEAAKAAHVKAAHKSPWAKD